MSHRFELVVFDWDGTIADSERRIVDALEGAIADLGLPPPRCSPRDIIGLGMREAVAALYRENAPPVHDSLVERYRERFLAAASDPVALFDGTVATVRAVSEAGHLVAVATGKSRRGLDRELAESGLSQWVVSSRCADEAPSKPNPMMLLELIEELGASAATTLMLGDTTYDMDMARAARAAALGVRTGVHEESRLRASGPLDILDSVADLPGWLGL